ncbi:hypothetical protein AVEN_228469-1 [Araneus ventricosus]|uniref:Uncharacterized protein n=1 Tax=Araneus ventricosus TaxID=182803 RepID=A0A4Y2UT23_ARAVE|nr:hypothetical protein AVEN_228469-1 [Araneus ventricosus]
MVYHEYDMFGQIVSEYNRGDVVFLPSKLAISDVNLPLFSTAAVPVNSNLQMTVKKSQGLSIMLNLPDEPVFFPDSSKVALSRSSIPNHVKIYTKTSEVQGKLLNNEKYFIRNVVYLRGFE